MGAGSERGLRYIAEATEGTTPSTPTMIPIRNTGGSGIQVNRTSILSAEQRSDRNIPDLSLGNNNVQLEIPFELIYGAYDDLFESLLYSTWSTDVLENGTTEQTFTVEEAFTDIDVYVQMLGARVSRLNLSIQPDAIITGSMLMRALEVSTPTTTTIADTVSAANTNSPMESFSAVVKLDSAAVAYVTGAELSVDNGDGAKFVVGSKNAYRMKSGRCNVSGTLNFSFEDKTYLDAFLNGTELALELTLSDGSNSYVIDVPRIKFSGESRNVSEDDIDQSLPFQGLYSSSDGYTIQITK